MSPFVYTCTILGVGFRKYTDGGFCGYSCYFECRFQNLWKQNDKKENLRKFDAQFIFLASKQSPLLRVRDVKRGFGKSADLTVLRYGHILRHR